MFKVDVQGKKSARVSSAASSPLQRSGPLLYVAAKETATHRQLVIYMKTCREQKQRGDITDQQCC